LQITIEVSPWGEVPVDPGREIALPSTFVISGEGQIRWHYVGEPPADRPPVEYVMEALRFIRH